MIERLKRSIPTFASPILMFFSDYHVSLDFFLAKTFVSVKKQVRTYDESTFVAEVGGFLGLLLGASVLTLLEMAELLFKKCIGKAEKEVK